jgi:membrane fusion protein (multidrug efflux system)
MLRDFQMSATTTSTKPRATRPPRTRGIVRLVVVLLILGMIGGGLIGFHLFKAGILKQVTASIVSQRPTVATATATLQDWQPALHATGTLRAVRGADLSAEIGGIVGELHFDSGDEVAAGTLLARLRPNDDEAKLQQLQATADLDTVTYQRDLRQLSAQGVSRATVDTDAGTLKAAQAQVAAQQALIAEKFVRAPFAGRLGLRVVDLGQYLAPGTKIVTLQALDPIYMDFYLPQQSIGQVRTGQAVTVHVDAFADRAFPGQIAALDAQADATSRMIQIRATLRNPDHALLPGMFGTVDIAAGAPAQHVTVPQTAITANAYGSAVYILRSETDAATGKTRLVAHQQFVTTGDTRGDQIAVLKGVAAGDVVVTAGALKLRNNVAVLVDNKVLPTDDANPTPTDN